MGVCTYLVCDKCKRRSYVCKGDPIKENLHINTIENFFFEHFNGWYGENDDKTCKGAFKLLTENQMTSKQWKYPILI